MHFALIAVVAVLGLWWFTRSRELFLVSVRAGRVLVVRGRVPPGLLGDFKDALKNSRYGTIKAIKQEHGARLQVSGDIDDGTAQRLRNIFGLYPASKLRQAPAIERPSFGQLMGIAWMAWLFEDLFSRR